MKKYKLKKAEFGLQKVEVPPGGSAGDIAQSALAGASAGAVAGPWGAAAGAVVGTTLGFISKGKKDRANKAAIAKNKYIEETGKYTGGNIYQSDQVLKDGTKGVKAESTGTKPSKKLFLGYPKVKPYVIVPTSQKQLDLIKIEEDQLTGDDVRFGITKTIQALDPTGISNYPDIIDAYKRGDKADLALSAISAIPIVGKIGKFISSTGKTVVKGARVVDDVKEGVNQYKKHYRTGVKNIKTKAIEIEGGEPVFTKTKGKFKLKYYAPDGPSHEEGGIPFNAKDGDVIFPEKMEDKVMKKYKTGDHKGLEKIRQTLPEDKPQKARRGYNGDPEVPESVQNINRYRQVPGRLRKNRLFLTPPYTKTPTINTSDPRGENAKVRQNNNSILKTNSQVEDVISSGMIRSKNNSLLPTNEGVGEFINSKRNNKNDQVIDIKGKYKTATGVPNVDMKSVTPGSSTQASVPKIKGKFDVNSGIALANTAYNMIKGLSPAETTPRNYVKMDRLKYQDSSDPDRLASTQARDVNKYNRQNYGGGNSANLQAGLAQDQADDFYRKQSINQRERGVAMNVQNGNIGIKNQEEMVNKGTSDQADYYDAQNRAARNSFLQQGITDLSTQAQQNLTDKDLRQGQENRFGLINSMYSNYKVRRDEDGVGVDYYKRKGTKAIKGYKMKKGVSVAN